MEDSPHLGAGSFNLWETSRTKTEDQVVSGVLGRWTKINFNRRIQSLGDLLQRNWIDKKKLWSSCRNWKL